MTAATRAACSWHRATSCTAIPTAIRAGFWKCSRETAGGCRCSRGACAGRRRNSAAELQPFRLLLLSWSGKGEAPHLTTARRRAGACGSAAREPDGGVLSERAAAEAHAPARSGERRVRRLSRHARGAEARRRARTESADFREEAAGCCSATAWRSTWMPARARASTPMRTIISARRRALLVADAGGARRLARALADQPGEAKSWPASGCWKMRAGCCRRRWRIVWKGGS